MSTYEYTDNSGDTLTISGAPSSVVLIARMKESVACNYIANADAPTVAAELLKAAGRSELAEMLEAVETERTARVEREAAEKKLQERRDALAGELSEVQLTYRSASSMTQRAIDRIIELEDGK